MTLQKRSLFDTATSGAIPRMEPKYVTRAQFATGTGTLVPGTAVNWDADDGLWRVWDGDGSDDQTKIDGFVWEEFDLSGSGEVIGAVMTEGEVHYDDILAINVTDESFGTANELQAALKSLEFRKSNLRVVGLAGTPE